jgi:superfamily I DNA/RNA helicase
MKSRLDELLGEASHAMRVSTFHSLGLLILREQHDLVGLNRGFGVCGPKQQRELCEHVLGRLEPRHIADYDFDDVNIRNLIRSISLAKNIGQEPEVLMESDCPDEQLTGHVLKAYNAELQRLQLIDLDDMVRLPVQILESNPAARRQYQEQYSHVLVDEYQDSNVQQNRLIRCLLGHEKNLCVVGDDDQSIYGFRGAQRKLILGFEREYPGAKVVKLTANCRCSSEIIGVANEVIADAPDRYAKQLVAANGSSVPVRFVEVRDAWNERRFIASDIRATRQRERRAFSDFAVLVRVSREGREITDELKKNGVPCGGKDGGINVMTLHASKGLEFPVVYLPGVEEDTIPHWNAKKGSRKQSKKNVDCCMWV